MLKQLAPLNSSSDRQKILRKRINRVIHLKCHLAKSALQQCLVCRDVDCAAFRTSTPELFLLCDEFDIKTGSSAARPRRCNSGSRGGRVASVGFQHASVLEMNSDRGN